jgi:hypothetical protein
MRERKSLGLVLVGISALLGLASMARADFLLVSQHLTLDTKDQTADFSLTFNQPPDFNTLNSQGQPADAFQVNFAGIYPTPGVNFPRDLTAVIRGEEIHSANGIPIRSATGNGGPEAGGWGPAIATVPFQLVGDSVDFSVPTTDLSWNGHAAQYRVFSLQYGLQTATETVTLVPTPTGLESGLFGLVIVAGVAEYVRRHSRSHQAHRGFHQ